MSNITELELEKVDEPCKSCDLYAVGRGKNKEIYCNIKNGKLMGDWKYKWSQLPDCPKRKPNIKI